jgi:hypothetical protein
MTSDYNLSTFKAISTFTNDLSEIFGGENHSLKLYQRLLNKTTITHEKAIGKHISAFRKFCVSNRDAILSKNLDKLSDHKIEYSSRVFIDLGSIMKSADKETLNIIWKHILTISAFVDPAGRAKDILKKTESSNESNFLESIINKVESNVNPNSTNPMEAVNSILNSGVLSELFTDMSDKTQNGTLDLGKLMGTVEKMCNTLAPPTADGKPSINLAGLMSSVGPLLSSLGTAGANAGIPQAGTGAPGGGLDINAMMAQILKAQQQPVKTEVVEEK